MQNFMKTIIHAIKLWVKNDAFTADDGLDVLINENFIEPLAAVDGTIYTSPKGEIYTLD